MGINFRDRALLVTEPKMHDFVRGCDTIHVGGAAVQEIRYVNLIFKILRIQNANTLYLFL